MLINRKCDILFKGAYFFLFSIKDIELKLWMFMLNADIISHIVLNMCASNHFGLKARASNCSKWAV